MRFIAIISVIMVTVHLTGCFNVASTGAQVVYNRRSIENTWNDQFTTMRIYQALNYKTKDFKDANIAIATYNGDVLLAGQVPMAWQRTKAEEITKNIPDIGKVYNLLTVEGPSSTITRMSDSWITAKVKAKLISSDDVDATKIKVVTENGVVYLMGILKPEEADAAIELTRNTGGVQQVVKIFSYINIYRASQSPAQKALVMQS